MKRKIIAVLALIVLCFSFAACSSEDASQDISYPPGPILYEVTDSDGDTVWLFGSIHSGLDYFYPLPDYIMNVFNKSEALAVEMDGREMNGKPASEVYAGITYTDNSTIDEHIRKDTYDAAVQLLTNYGIYKPEMDKFKPVVWSIIIENKRSEEAGVSSELGVDTHLLDCATQSKKEIIEIEGMDTQVKLLTSLSDDVQEALLTNTVGYLPVEGEEEELAVLWYSGDEQALLDYIAPGNEQEPEEGTVAAEYKKVMTTDRNILMTEFAEKALADGKNVFICVGAAHVLGKGGMAELLAEKGYTVTRLYDKELVVDEEYTVLGTVDFNVN